MSGKRLSLHIEEVAESGATAYPWFRAREQHRALVPVVGKTAYAEYAWYQSFRSN